MEYPEAPRRPTRPVPNGREPYYAIGVQVHTDRLIGLLLDLDGVVLDLGSPTRGLQGHGVSRLQADLSATDVPTVVDAVASMARNLLRARPDLSDSVVGLGISIGGHVDGEAGIVRFSPNLNWNGEVRLADLLRQATGFDTVAVENDVNVLVDTEQWSETGGRYRRFAVVKVGAGIGCGLSLHRGLERGATGAAGELGHIPFVLDNGRRCICGKRGCLETVASADAILNEIRELGGPDIDEIEKAADRARAGDELFVMAFQRAGEALGIGLSVLLNVVNLEAVVLCGPAALLRYDPYIAATHEALRLHAFSTIADDCELLVEAQTDELEARGAASMALGHLFDVRG